MPLDINTRPVGFEENLNAIINRINRRGLNVKINASNFTQPLGRITDKANEFQKSIEASNARVIAFGASAAIIGSVGKAFEQMVVQAVKVEKILTDINVVLNTSASNLEKFGNSLFDVARNTAQTLDTAAEAALEFSRQGLSMEETLKRTNDALVLTRLTGMKAADSVRGLTAAVNSYADTAVTTTEIINKLAAVDVKFAVSADDLINALSRAGAVAQDAGLSMDQLIASVTSAQQITARGGAVIGNSFKTIFTRLQRSSTLERLEELGIAVRSVKGDTLPAIQVLTQLAKTYDGLGDATKAAVAEQVGGVFQINILKAALKDLNKENSLSAQALQVSMNATDEARRKNEMLNKTLSSLAAQTNLTIQELASNLGELALAPGIEGLLDKINSLGQSLNNLLSEDSTGIGADFAKGIVKGIGNVLTGPGMVLAVGVFAKLFFNALKFARQSLKDVLGIVSKKDKELKIQNAIVEAMQQNRILAEELNKAANDKVKQEQIVLGVIEQQTKQMELQQKIAQGLAPALQKAGVNADLTMPRTNNARGFIPNFSAPTEKQKRMERREAAKGGYTAGAVKVMEIPGYGEVAYNQAEKIKKFKGMSQPAIMPPEESKAGSRYKRLFSQAHGFNPYAGRGFIPNFADGRTRSQKIQDYLADPANKNVKFKQRAPSDLSLRKAIARQFREEYNLEAGLKPGAMEEIVSGLLRSYKRDAKGYGVGGKGSSRYLTYGTPPNQIKISRFQVDNPGGIGYAGGFIPNFATREGDLLRLGTAMSSVAVQGGGLRNRMLDKQVQQAIQSGAPMYMEAGVDEIIPKRGSHNASLFDLLQTLKGKGIRRIGRKMFLHSAARTSTLRKGKNETDGELSERAKLSQLHSAGEGKKKALKALKSDGGIAGGLGINPAGKKVLPSEFKKYISTGTQLGGGGDDTFNTDFIGEGLRPIENKKGRFTIGNLLFKSFRSYSDSELLHYIKDNYQDMGNLVSGVNAANYNKSEQLLRRKGIITQDMSAEEKRNKILSTFTANGFIPNFAYSNTAVRLDGGFGRRGRIITDKDTGSFMTYTTNEIGDREIDFLKSNQKGDAFKMFKREAGGKFMKGGGAYASSSLKQQRSFMQGGRTNFEDLVYAFPQLKYRMQPNMVTTGRLIHGPEGRRIRFDSLKDLRDSVNRMDRQGFRDALGAFPGMPGMDVISVQDLITVNTSAKLGDNIYGQAAKGLVPKRKGGSAVSPRTLNLSWMSPEPGTGTSQIRSIYKDIIESAKAGRPYTDLKAGFIVGPRIPRLLVEGQRLLNSQRAAGKNIPRMNITGDITPAKLMQYINENKQRMEENHPFARKEDYKAGEEREVASYLRAMGLDPLSFNSSAVEDLAMFKNGFARGFIPNFAKPLEKLKAIKVTSKPIPLDGDSLVADVEFAGIAQEVDHRLMEVDAVEKGQVGEKRAMSIIQGYTARDLFKNRRDIPGSYGRSTFKDDELARRLVEEGVGIPDLRYTTPKKYRTEILKAARKKKGIWADGNENHPKRKMYEYQAGVIKTGEHYASTRGYDTRMTKFAEGDKLEALQDEGMFAPADPRFNRKNQKLLLTEDQRKKLFTGLTYVGSRAAFRPSASGFIPNYIKSRVGGRDFAKLSVALANFNRRNMIMPPVKALSGQELFKIPRRSSDAAEATIQNIRQFISSDEFRNLPPDLQMRVTKFYNRKFARRMQSDPGRAFARYSDPSFEGRIVAGSGLVPNFAQNALTDAINREKSAGVPRSQMRIERDSKLINKENPLGLAVTNIKDEPAGISQGIRRAIREKRDPQKYGAGAGLIPNFAEGDAAAPGIMDKVSKKYYAMGDAMDSMQMRLFGLTTATYAMEGVFEEMGLGFMGSINQMIQSLSNAALIMSALSPILEKTQKSFTSAGGKLEEFGKQIGDGKGIKNAFDSIFRQSKGEGSSGRDAADIKNKTEEITEAATEHLEKNQQCLKESVAAQCSAVGGPTSAGSPMTSGPTLLDSQGRSLKTDDIGERIDATRNRSRSSSRVSRGGAAGRLGGALGRIRGLGAVTKTLSMFGKIARPIGALAAGAGKLLGVFGRFLPFVGIAITAFQGLSGILQMLGIDLGKMIKGFGESIGAINAFENSVSELDKATQASSKTMEARANVRGIEDQLEELYSKGTGELSSQDAANIRKLSNELVNAQRKAAEALNEFSNSLDDVFDRIEDTDTAGNEFRSDLEEEILKMRGVVTSGQATDEEMQQFQGLLDTKRFTDNALAQMEEASTEGIDFGQGDDSEGVAKRANELALVYAEQAGRLKLTTKQFEELEKSLGFGGSEEQIGANLANFADKLKGFAEDEDLDEISRGAAQNLVKAMEETTGEMLDEGYTLGQMNDKLRERMEVVRKKTAAERKELEQIEASTQRRSEMNKQLKHDIALQISQIQQRDRLMKQELSLMSQRIALMGKINQASEVELNNAAAGVKLAQIDQNERSQLAQSNVKGLGLETLDLNTAISGDLGDREFSALDKAIRDISKKMRNDGLSASEGLVIFSDKVKELNLELEQSISRNLERRAETTELANAGIREDATQKRNNETLVRDINNLNKTQAAFIIRVRDAVADNAQTRFGTYDDQLLERRARQLFKEQFAADKGPTGAFANRQGKESTNEAAERMVDQLQGDITRLPLADGTTARGRQAESRLVNFNNLTQADQDRFKQFDSNERKAFLEIIGQAQGKSVAAGQGSKLDERINDAAGALARSQQMIRSADRDTGQLVRSGTSFSAGLREEQKGANEAKLQELGGIQVEQQTENTRINNEEIKGKIKNMRFLDVLVELTSKRLSAEQQLEKFIMESVNPEKAMGETRKEMAAQAAIRERQAAKTAAIDMEVARNTTNTLKNYSSINELLDLRIATYQSTGDADKGTLSFIGNINSTLQNEQTQRLNNISQMKIITALRKEGIKTEEGVITGIDIERTVLEEAIQTKKSQISANRDMLRNTETMAQDSMMELALQSSNARVANQKSKINLEQLDTETGILFLRNKILNELQEQTNLNKAETINLREQLLQRRKPVDGQGNDTEGIAETRSLIRKRVGEEALALEKVKEERQLIQEKIGEKLQSLDLETETVKLETDILRALNSVQGLSEEESVIRKSLNEAIQARVENEIQQLERSAQDNEDQLKERRKQGFFGVEAGTNRRNRITEVTTNVDRARAKADSYGLSGNTMMANQANVELAKSIKEFNIEAGRNTLFWDTINVKIAEATERAGRFSETLAETAFDGVKDGFKGLLKDLSTGTESFGDAFLKMAGTIASKMQEKIFDQAADRLTAGLFDIMPRFHSGGVVTNFASGGRTKGDIPAMLTAGEYVVRKKAVDAIGKQALDRVNKGQSLDDLFEKPNSESFDVLGGDMDMFGASSNTPMQTLSTPILDPSNAGKVLGTQNVAQSQSDSESSASERIEERLKEINNNFKEGGKVTSSTSKVIEKLFNGGIVGMNYGGDLNQAMRRRRSSRQNMEDIGYGLGVMAGAGYAGYLNRKNQAPEGGPPEPPKTNRLNTSSTLDLDFRDPRLSARFRKMDTTSQEYGKYLIDKYEYNVQKQNKKVAEKASFISSIANSLATVVGSAIGSKLGSSIQNRMAGARMSGSGQYVGRSPSGEPVKIHRDQNGNIYAMEGNRKVDFMGNNGRTQSAAAQHMAKWQMQNGNPGTGKLSSKDAGAWWSSYSASGRPGFAQKFQTQSNATYNSGGIVSNTSSNNSSIVNQNIETELNRIYREAARAQAYPQKFAQGGVIQGFSNGGFVRGPGGIDRVGPVMLDDGEYVIKASSVQKMERENPGMLDRLNGSRGFAEGGMVTNQSNSTSSVTNLENTSSQNSNSASTNNVTVNISVGGSAGSGGDSTTVEGNATEGQSAMASRLKAAVLQVISEEQRVGGMLRGN